MSAFLRMPPRGRSGPWILALSIALVLAIQPIWPDRIAIGVAVVIGATLLAATQWQLRWSPVVVLVACALVLRLSVFSQEASDVADVTRWAIWTAQHGSNPYGIGYDISRPAGAPFPYGPVALLWYAPYLRDPAAIEVFVAMLVTLFLGVMAGRGRPLGLAIYAVAPPIVLASADGSNDTSAGLLILIALVVAAKRPAIGAALLAVAIAFKPYAIAWLPGLLLWGGVSATAAFVAASVVAWSPVLFVWGTDSYMKSLAMAQQTHLRSSYWSLGAIWEGLLLPGSARPLESIRYVLSGALAVVGAWLARSYDRILVIGILAFVVAQFGGYFGSFVYLGAIAPLLCWRVDDWLDRLLPELSHAYQGAPPIELGRRIVRRPILETARAGIAWAISPARRRLAPEPALSQAADESPTRRNRSGLSRGPGT